MSDDPKTPAGAPVTAPVAPVGSTPRPRVKVGRTPFAPVWLERPWYAGVWDAARDDWSLQPEWFETWPEAMTSAYELYDVQLWLDEFKA